MEHDRCTDRRASIITLKIFRIIVRHNNDRIANEFGNLIFVVINDVPINKLTDNQWYYCPGTIGIGMLLKRHNAILIFYKLFRDEIILALLTAKIHPATGVTTPQ